MPKRPLPKIVDLSIDFDFWVREKFSWDWGHGEGDTTTWDNIAWQARYATSLIHVFKATDPNIYADFYPTLINLFPQLLNRNLVLIPNKLGEFGYADSHKHAYPFFLRKKGRSGAYRTPPDVLVNIDAHHDCYSHGELHCGNWLLKLMEEWKNTKFVQVYPTWRANEKESTIPDILECNVWNTWEGLKEPHRVRHIFLCRSSGWVPPHLDTLFVNFLTDIHFMFGPQKSVDYGGLFQRSYPTLEEYNENYLKVWECTAESTKLFILDLMRSSVHMHGEDSFNLDLLPKPQSLEV